MMARILLVFGRLVIALFLLAIAAHKAVAAEVVLVPKIGGEWWQIA
jgi:hypothetical protein